MIGNLIWKGVYAKNWSKLYWIAQELGFHCYSIIDYIEAITVPFIPFFLPFNRSFDLIRLKFLTPMEPMRILNTSLGDSKKPPTKSMEIHKINCENCTMTIYNGNCYFVCTQVSLRSFNPTPSGTSLGTTRQCSWYVLGWGCMLHNSIEKKILEHARVLTVYITQNLYDFFFFFKLIQFLLPITHLCIVVLKRMVSKDVW